MEADQSIGHVSSDSINLLEDSSPLPLDISAKPEWEIILPTGAPDSSASYRTLASAEALTATLGFVLGCFCKASSRTQEGVTTSSASLSSSRWSKRSTRSASNGTYA